MPCFLSNVTHSSFSCAVFQISPPLCWITAAWKTVSQHVRSSFVCCKSLCLRSRVSGCSKEWLFAKGSLTGPCVAAAQAQGWQPGSAQSPDPHASPQWWGQAGTSRWPWALAAKPPRAGLLSRHVHWVCRIAHVWKYLLDLAFEVIQANNTCLICVFCERTEIAVVVYCFWICTERVLGCVLHDACFTVSNDRCAPRHDPYMPTTLTLVMAHVVVFTVHWSSLLNKQKWANLIFWVS